jgi:predicted secreted hydrolase
MKRFLRISLTVVLVLVQIEPRNEAASQAPQEGARPQVRFCKALPGYRFEFPRDHFSHPCFKTEWWYFTGNLSDRNGRRFGFELTFFREGIENVYPNPSRWRVDDLYLAHFAVSDLAGKKFFYAERLHRAGIELAGADLAKGRIWNADWSAELRPAPQSPGLRTPGRGESWRLEAADGGQRIRLELRPLKPPVIQGRDGVSQKAAGEGNASHYYSLTRLETTGVLETGGSTYDVTGLSWMDHEFATNQLQPNQVGWEWVSLQLDDGSDWMFYQLRLASGGAGGEKDPHSSGAFVPLLGVEQIDVPPNNRAVQLSAEDFEMTPLEEWRSPRSNARYPIRWRIRAPKHGLDVTLSAAMPDQELRTQESTGVIYWEGSATAQGTRNGKPIQGRGYLEMTGYAGRLSPGLYSAD